MVTSRFSKLFFSLFWLLISIAHCHAQIVPEELHDIDAFIADDGFQREQGEKVARLLVGFGKTELDNLKRLKNERPLDDIEAFRLEGLSNILAPIVSQRPDLKATLTFIHNPEIAKSVYRLVGQDRISELVASKIQSVVRSRVMHALKHSFSPVTVLDDDELRKALGLSEEQVVQLDKIHEETSERIRLGDPDAYQQIEHLLQSHWEQLLAVLDSKQSKIARNSIGSPIPWFKARKKLSFFGDSVSSHGFITVNGGIDNQAPDGRYLHNLSADELKQIGVDFLYMHCQNMLKSQFVLEEMEITPDQRKEIEKGIRKTTTIPSVQKGRIIELLGDEPTFPSFLEKELQDHQMQLSLILKII